LQSVIQNVLMVPRQKKLPGVSRHRRVFSVADYLRLLALQLSVI